jgi:hypothetical protein
LRARVPAGRQPPSSFSLALGELCSARCTSVRRQTSHFHSLEAPTLYCCLSLFVMASTTMRSSSSLLRAFARNTAPRAARSSHAEYIPAPAKRLFHTPRTSAAIRPSPILARTRLLSAVRFESSAASPTSANAPESRLEREQVPSYELTFTCNVCRTRSSHRLSKQGYHHGTVLIQCPDCKNRHLIADHLKVR